MRCDRAYVSGRLHFDTQQREFCSIGGCGFERDMGEAEKARRVHACLAGRTCIRCRPRFARIAFSFFVDADALPGEIQFRRAAAVCNAKPVFDAIRSHLRKR